jgi:hypothetical protein
MAAGAEDGEAQNMAMAERFLRRIRDETGSADVGGADSEDDHQQQAGGVVTGMSRARASAAGGKDMGRTMQSCEQSSSASTASSNQQQELEHDSASEATPPQEEQDPAVEDGRPAQRHRRADLYFSCGGEDGNYIDVSICSSSARSYMEYNTASTPLAAAGIREQAKRQQYRAHYPVLVAEGKVLPFIIEATGRLGQVAEATLQGICTYFKVGSRESKELINSLKARIGGIVMRYNAKMVHFGAEVNNAPNVHTRASAG